MARKGVITSIAVTSDLHYLVMKYACINHISVNAAYSHLMWIGIREEHVEDAELFEPTHPLSQN